MAPRSLRLSGHADKEVKSRTSLNTGSDPKARKKNVSTQRAGLLFHGSQLMHS